MSRNAGDLNVVELSNEPVRAVVISPERTVWHLVLSLEWPQNNLGAASHLEM
ncbi:hypothetical protein NDI76_11560 [Halogeometricum sp. S1BR25-6]|uniref:Uncharacterized protein n=1 Tax=Halogeometricum salsisoli TaxID=2950536 RepID=A0ABU2GGU7_9EURY|nr:hypothetical protein [Halogeometricum sp. S1BR25-6]MDS0299379.1 hypothetical protein [Halogeometricum sp. S1BR25-6]